MLEILAIVIRQEKEKASTTRDYHTKWSKSERERQIPYDITYMWNLKYDTNEPIYETEIESGT